MKRAGFIYEKIYSKENIINAIKQAAKGKKDRRAVKRVLSNLDDCIEEIQYMLITETYQPSDYRKKTIHEGICQKERVICIPKFYPDQIIQWAIILQIKPYLCRGMDAHVCGSVPGRGGACGKKYIERWLRNSRKHTKYCLKLDVHHFYPSIDHQCLKNMLQRLFKDEKLLNLLYEIVDSEAGLPIGNITSQWFANFYLQGLDHFIKETLHATYYVRYMDDMVLFGANKKELHRMFLRISEYLKSIGLVVKSNWQIFKTDSRGVDFLGYRFFHYKTILRRSVMLRISRKVKKTNKRHSWNYHNCAAIISYLGWIKHSDSYQFYQIRIGPYINVKRIKGVVRRENYKHKSTNYAV